MTVTLVRPSDRRRWPAIITVSLIEIVTAVLVGPLVLLVLL